MTRGSSPQLVGRDAELERLREAVRSARESDRCVVLLSGEAGIGKSRLLAELERSIGIDPPTGRDVSVLRGGCVEVGESLAYLPVLELLAGIAEMDPGRSADAERLRHAFGGGADPVLDEATRDAIGRAARFQRLRELLAGAAIGRDVVAVIDDLHWADRSTLDVVSFLARRLAGTGAILVLAYRSDELHRRHPLKPILADLGRQATLDHIRLEPLDPAGVASQVAGILGTDPGQERLKRVVELADGNPFHVEELLSLEGDRRLPPSLREVLDARLDQLDDGSRRVVQEAAVIGRRVDADLLAMVSDDGTADVAGGLRQAVDARILVSAEDGRHYHFRHALLREAVYDDLTPVERIEAHRRVARVLTDHPGLGDPNPNVAIADRARHWQAARAEPEAFEALLEAARSAEGASAWAEARAAYEEALTLWGRIADPGTVAGSARSEVLERAMTMAYYDGDTRRALTLDRQAQLEPDVRSDPYRLGNLVHREAWYLDELGELEAAGHAAQRAYDLVPDAPPTADRAIAVATMGVHAQREGRIHEAIGYLERSISIYEHVADDNDLAGSLAYLATARVDIGDQDRAMEAVERIDRLEPGIRDHETFFAVSTCLPWVWIATARYDRAIASADRYMANARERGLDLGVGLWYLAPRALAEFWLGRWDDASETIGQQGGYARGIDPGVHLSAVAALVAGGRGDVAVARSVAAETIDLARAGYPEHAIVARAAAAWVELLDGHADIAVEHIRSARSSAVAEESILFGSHLSWIGAWAAADLAERSRSRDDSAGITLALEVGAHLEAVVEAAIQRLDDGSARPSGPSAMRLTLEFAGTELARLHDRDDAATWSSLGDRFEQLGDLPRAALARQRQAEAILRDGGEPAEAATALRAVLAHAGTMGATRLGDRALAVARAARLEIGEALSPPAAVTPVPVDPWGLSVREREVLALLADGRTNRQIGEALFISDKTASVHVTHILDKMGVSSRTEAALLAVRAGIDSDADG